MARRKKDEPNTRPVMLRVTEADYARLESVAKTLGLDLAQVVRTLVRRQLPHMEHEANELRQLEQQQSPHSTHNN